MPLQGPSTKGEFLVQTLGREPQRGSCKQIGGRHLKKVETTPFSFFFCTFFSLWCKQFLFGVGDAEHGEGKRRRGKNTKSGGSDPTFSAFSRPKSLWGRSRPPALVTVPDVFSTVQRSFDNATPRRRNMS